MGFITLYDIRCLDSMLAKNRMSHPNVRIVLSNYRNGQQVRTCICACAYRMEFPQNTIAVTRPHKPGCKSIFKTAKIWLK